MIISAFIAIASIIRPIDLAVYEKYYLNSYLSNYSDQLKVSENDDIDKEINDKIIFIDIPTTDDSDWLEKLRSNIADILLIIDSKVNSTMSDLDKPVVILDIAFRSETTGLRPIKDALMSLRDKKVKVYAPYKLPESKSNITFNEHDKDQNKSLYNIYFEGKGKRLNTAFHNHTEVNGLLSYYSFETLEDSIINSLPVKVANDYKRIEKNADLPEVEPIQYVVPLKLPFDPASTENIYYEYSNDSTFTSYKNFSSLIDTIDISKKFIIIGTPGDQLEIGKEGGSKFIVPGPYIVATALIDQLNGNKFTKPPYDNVVFQLTLIIFFAFVVCLIFAVIYKYIKKLQTRPSIIAILSWILGVSIFIGLGYLLLEFVIIRPTLPAISMFWAALLAWHFTKKFLVTGIMDGGEVYDVFISYSFGDSTWVKQNLFNPLNEFKKPDGEKLKIFFAEKSIGIGELFTTKYMRAIVDSKLFVPVMSQEYYKKNHCRNEMDLAVKRKIEKLINICIVTFDYKYVPEEFTNILLLDVKQQSNFMKTLQNEMVNEKQNQLEESDTVKKQLSDPQSQKQQNKTDTTKPMELDNQEPKPTDKSDLIEAVNLEHQEAEPSEKEEIVISDKKGSDKKVKKSKKKYKKSDKKAKKKSKKEEKDIEKKSKKEEKEKAKKKDKKSKKEKGKKVKKSSEKKDKKVKAKKAKKSSDKKNKKAKKKKGKKS
jgi:hypothetical protein